MGKGRLFGAWGILLVGLLLAGLTLAGLATPFGARSARAQANCALTCERDRRCRAWTFSYPTDITSGAVCWLKSNVPPRVPENCCVSGVRGAGVVEPRNGAVETSIDRAGGDYKSFEMKSGEGDELCKAACTGDNKCRAWTFARAGYVGREAH